MLLRGLDWGVAYGGGFLDRAASQSKGTDEEMEGVNAGERRKPIDGRWFLGVEGRTWGETGESVEVDVDLVERGVMGVFGEEELDADALFI